MKYKDSSTTLRKNETGFVDNKFVSTNAEGYNILKIKIRNQRMPTIGDKFSSRHGQKGTVGIVYKQEDIPYTKDGIVPDIIVNPHAIPSRMTIAQLMECILGKACVNYGYLGDGTAFNNVKVEDISNILMKSGYEKNGNEVLYNGINGEQINTDIFIGPTYYQKLKHMSQDVKYTAVQVDQLYK